MIRYLAVACALKLFSLSPQTRKLYRRLGNKVGAKKRSQAGLPASYRDRAKWVLGLFEKYQIADEGARLLELGTGWVHWESTVLRLFYRARTTLFDVWDNRQFPAYKVYVSQFRDVLEREFEASPRQQEARDLLEAIMKTGSFAELYDLLGFRYVVEPTGTLEKLDAEAYDACFSYNVFEHIDAALLPDYIKGLYRVLKPGGYAFITIDISDHLANYDRSVGRKNYLRYSDAVWKLCFENEVQYFNRVQRSEWLRWFSEAGFELVEEKTLSQAIRMKVARQYADLDPKDVRCTALKIVHRKPVGEGTPLAAGLPL